MRVSQTQGDRMGMLDRYRKPGGFIQLLTLLETCGAAKRERFLQLIKEEDPVWAEVIEKKILTLKRVFTWDDNAIAEVVGAVQELTLAVAMHGMDDIMKARVDKTFTHAQRRRISDLFNTSKPNQAEINTMFEKILVEVRRLISEGKLRLEKIDPPMAVEDGIEDKLQRQVASFDPVFSDQTDPSNLNFDLAHAIGHEASSSNEEVMVLRKKVIVLNKENASLKQELLHLKHKIEQIKKIV